ncbi:hypothetical protein TVAG_198760 [Trichomonas vaginalis G3]|uniref:RSE1/DDB1/CPSF1 first beta-propeller domain-containing protein n=1 Tax=Trichomonas vaginalis (strain ATCC PRA-98 / G3) TaxID=412133 RepID=A2DDR1_TRIV3|nr:DNA repair/RNA processing CPSF family [Trichomonas vaginalis G3]EAY21437.1 hypothetical protein TVAG_198760 [Trichomonas vaginalis G3]KAI5490650.1 DNA repair/RNA processing CPSF family [Trichomonas vaginalis G3]|eukprot:XP_001582423.1 hypothetical protein [Trichomonas vaginalis G3]
MPKIGYALQSIVEEIPLAGAVKFRMNSNQSPVFVIPKRYSLEFYEIKSTGISPLYIIPFHKTIYSLKVMPANYWGKPSTIDVLILFFNDSSFIIFNDPNKPIFKYNPKDIQNNFDYCIDIHPRNAFIAFSHNTGLINFWDGSQPNRQEKVYKLPVSTDPLIDMKFLYTDEVMISTLHDMPDNHKRVNTKILDLSLLFPNENPDLTFDIEDDDANLIIPLQKVSDDNPIFLVCGKLITVCSNNSTFQVECPFKGNPSCFDYISQNLIVICDESGQIFLINIDTDVSVTFLGEVKTIPTSIVYIDNGIFYIGSRVEDALFVKYHDDKLTVLTVSSQFRPSTFCSEFSDLCGSFFISHGTKNGGGAITSVKTGLFYKEMFDAKMTDISTISKVDNNKFMMSTNNKISFVFDTDNQKILLKNNEKTIDCFQTENGFIQVCSDKINIIDGYKITKTVNLSEILSMDSEQINVSKQAKKSSSKSDKNKSKSKENLENESKSDNKFLEIVNYEEISSCAYDNKNKIIFIAVGDKIKVIDLSLKVTKSFEFPEQIKSISYYKKLLAAITWSGFVSTIDDSNLCTLQKPHDFTPDKIFVLRSEANHRIIIVYMDGFAMITKKDLTIVKKTVFGHICCGSFMNDEKSVIILGSSPSLYFTDGNSMPLILSNEDYFCGLRLSKEIIIMADQEKFVVGNLNESELCQINTTEFDVVPFLLTMLQKPPSLFIGYFQEGIFGLMSLNLPSMKVEYDIKFENDMELSSLISLSNERICIGLTGKNEGKIQIIENVFDNYTIVGNHSIEGGVFALSKFNENHLIVCGRCRLFFIEIQTSTAGAVTFNVLQAIQCPSICRSCFSMNEDIVILFDSFRSIISFKLNGNFLERVNEFPVNKNVVCGCIGDEIKPGVYDLYSADDNGYLHVYKMNVDDCSMKEISNCKLSASVSCLSKVRENFVICTTRNGGVMMLTKVDEKLQNSLEKARDVVFDLFRNDNDNDKYPIVDATNLQCLNCAPSKAVSSALEARNTTISEVNFAVQQLKSYVAKICSTK